MQPGDHKDRGAADWEAAGFEKAGVFKKLFFNGCTGSPLLCELSPVVLSRGYFIVVASSFLISVAPLVAVCVLSSWGTRAWMLHSTWDLSGPGMEPLCWLANS